MCATLSLQVKQGPQVQQVLSEQLVKWAQLVPQAEQDQLENKEKRETWVLLDQ